LLKLKANFHAAIPHTLFDKHFSAAIIYFCGTVANSISSFAFILHYNQSNMV